jgi:hypothetical protein
VQLPGVHCGGKACLREYDLWQELVDGCTAVIVHELNIYPANVENMVS